MALLCEFINIIIPIEHINRVYPGGFAEYKVDHAEEFKGRMYHDEFLFRDGAMNSLNAQEIVSEWEKRGLVALKNINGNEHWHDLCVVDMMSGLTRPCEWAVYNTKMGYVYLKGQPPTPVIG